MLKYLSPVIELIFVVVGTILNFYAIRMAPPFVAISMVVLWTGVFSLLWSIASMALKLKPSRWQYILGAAIILIGSIITYLEPDGILTVIIPLIGLGIITSLALRSSKKKI